jgi:hypothetical protein
MKVELMNRRGNGPSSERETLFMLGGVALVIVGAGMILSHPTVRQYIDKSPLGNVVSNLIPDVQRYLKLRAM